MERALAARNELVVETANDEADRLGALVAVASNIVEAIGTYEHIAAAC